MIVNINPKPMPSTLAGRANAGRQQSLDADKKAVADNIAAGGDGRAYMGPVGADGSRFSVAAGTNLQKIVDPNSYILGRSPNYAKDTADAMQNVGMVAGGQMASLAGGALNQGNAAASQMNALGYAGMNDMAKLGAQQQALGQAGMGDMANLGMQSIGLGLNAQNQVGGYGTGQGAAIAAQGAGAQQQLGAFGGALDARGQAAAGRATPATDYTRANATQGNVLGNVNALAGLEAQQGPSAAQAQLQSGLNAAQASNLAMARSGRGWGGSASALSQAAGLNAAAGQQAANQSAMLRAQEDAAWRQRQAANLGAAGQLGTGIAGQQIGQEQFLTGADLQSRQINDQAQIAMQGQALQGMTSGHQLAQQGAIAGGQLGLQGLTQGAQLGLQGQQMGIDAYGRGLDYGMQGAQNNANLYGQGLNYGMQGAQNANAAAMGGIAGAGQLGQAAYGMQMGGLGAATDVWRTQGQMDMAREQNVTQQYGIEAGVGVQNNATNLQLLGAGLALGGAAIGSFAGPAGTAAGGAAGAAGGQAIQRI